MKQVSGSAACLILSSSMLTLVLLSGSNGRAQAAGKKAATTTAVKVSALLAGGVHDYIPCLLNPDELARLHGVAPQVSPGANGLSKEQAALAAQEILASVKELVPQELSLVAEASFDKQITALSLQGSDPQQMVNTVQTIT